MRKSNDYYLNRHACFLLQYHLVLVTKYRHPVIKNEIDCYLKSYIHDYFKERDCNILEIESNKDHIHILFECSPNILLSDFINAFKSASSRKIRKEFARQLESYYWKPYFWSNSYFIGSVSPATTDAVKAYIAKQKD